jgi:hypothetical protein
MKFLSSYKVFSLNGTEEERFRNFYGFYSYEMLEDTLQIVKNAIGSPSLVAFLTERKKGSIIEAFVKFAESSSISDEDLPLDTEGYKNLVQMFASSIASLIAEEEKLSYNKPYAI